MKNMINKIIQGDCLDVMKDIPDKSIDCILTDPPYNNTDLDFDKIKLSDDWVNQSFRVLKDNGYLIAFAPPELSVSIGKIFHKRFNAIWLKDNSNPRFHNSKIPRNQFELITIFCKNKKNIPELIYNKVYNVGTPYKIVQRFSGFKRTGKDQIDRASISAWTKDGYLSENEGNREQTDVFVGNTKGTMKHNERTIHPTQKPLNVLDKLILMLTSENDIILDPFTGSGSTSLSASNNKRQYIGIEINPEYCEIARKRISTTNYVLFG